MSLFFDVTSLTHPCLTDAEQGDIAKVTLGTGVEPTLYILNDRGWVKLVPDDSDIITYDRIQSQKLIKLLKGFNKLTYNPGDVVVISKGSHEDHTLVKVLLVLKAMSLGESLKDYSSDFVVNPFYLRDFIDYLIFNCYVKKVNAAEWNMPIERDPGGTDIYEFDVSTVV